MITRPKISQNEWKTTEIGAFEVGQLRTLFLPGDELVEARERAVHRWSCTGQEKGAKFPTSKAPISVVFHSFWLIFGRVIISRNGLDRERLSLERARAERPR